MLGKLLRMLMHFSCSRKSELALTDRSCSRVTLVLTRFCRVFSASASLSWSFWMVSSISLTSLTSLEQGQTQLTCELAKWKFHQPLKTNAKYFTLGYSTCGVGCPCRAPRWACESSPPALFGPLSVDTLYPWGPFSESQSASLSGRSPAESGRQQTQRGITDKQLIVTSWLSVSFMKITGHHSRWWLKGWKRTDSDEGKSHCLRRSSKKLHTASFESAEHGAAQWPALSRPISCNLIPVKHFSLQLIVAELYEELCVSHHSCCQCSYGANSWCEFRVWPSSN